MINLLCIQIILVFITDLSGVVDYIQPLVWKWLFPKIPYKGAGFKILNCSLCQTWWTGILYILITGFTWKLLLYVALLAYFTPVTKDLLIIIKELIIKLLNKIC